MIRIILPAYNEGANLGPLCRSIDATLKPLGLPYLLVIVDDGSQDNTPQVLRELNQLLPILTVVHQENRGVLQAFRSGFKAALEGSRESDIIILMEGDGTSDPALLPAIIGHIQGGKDLVVASRYLSGGAYRNFPWKRLWASKAANFVLRILFPIPHLRDYTIFFRAYRQTPLQKCFETYGEEVLTYGHFVCNTELLLKLRPFLKEIVEIPLVYDYGKKQGRSGMRVLRNALMYLHLIASNLGRNEFRP